MDETYLSQVKPKNRWGVIVLLIVVVFVLGASLYLYFSGGKKVISPVPPQPSFEVIFYTPTPAPVTPTSTPSATPKVKPTTAPTKVPTLTPKVTSVATPSAATTTKPTATSTPKP